MARPSALILCGGKGSRLEPWKAPKCLLPVNGVPILYRLIRHLEPHVEKITICTGYRAENVTAAVASYRLPNGNQIQFSNAGENASMMGRLRTAWASGVVEGRALVCYGDELADVDIPALLKQHEEFHAAQGTRITICRCYHYLSFGVFEGAFINDRHRVEVNIGFAVVEPEAWDFGGDALGLSDFYNAQARGGYGASFRHDGHRATVNSPADIAGAEQVWA